MTTPELEIEVEVEVEIEILYNFHPSEKAKSQAFSPFFFFPHQYCTPEKVQIRWHFISFHIISYDMS